MDREDSDVVSAEWCLPGESVKKCLVSMMCEVCRKEHAEEQGTLLCSLCEEICNKIEGRLEKYNLCPYQLHGSIYWRY